VPTYEYECSSCDATHEVVQKMTDATLTECPECGHSPIRKLFTGVGVVFKGSGFYRNDSRSSGESGTGSSSSTTATKSESTKSETTKSGTTKADTSSSTSTTTSAPAKTESKKPASTT
jgi:putative FmdB family regulatory protein